MGRPGKSPLSAQAQLLRRKVVGRLVRELVACVAVFLVAVWALHAFAADRIGELLADSAEWSVFDSDAPGTEAELQTLLHSKPNAAWDVQENHADGTIWVRDLTLYNAVKAAWLPALACLAMAVMLGFVFAAFRRMYSMVDDLTGAVTGLLEDETRPISLPLELAVAERELNGLRQEQLLRDESAARDRERTQELMAYLVHDVRTPLTAVMGNLALLEEGDLPPQNRELVEVASRRAEGIDGLTSDLFDVTRLALDPASMTNQPIDLRLLTVQVAEELAGNRPERARSAPSGSSESVTVVGDAELLAKAVRHLLESACAMAAPDSAVSVDGGVRGSAALLVARVQTGLPTSQETRALAERAFAPYYRRGSSSGISLAFAREIARAHGGDVTAFAEGTAIRIELTLPAAPAASAT